MQAVVKTPRIEINIKGDIPEKLLSLLEEEYGEQIQLLDDSEDETVDIFATEWYRDIKSRMSPGDNLRIYRQNRGWTQAKLGEMLGGIPRQHISNMETGEIDQLEDSAEAWTPIRGISREIHLGGLDHTDGEPGTGRCSACRTGTQPAGLSASQAMRLCPPHLRLPPTWRPALPLRPAAACPSMGSSP